MTKVLIIYDSFFGNTEKIADAIATGSGPTVSSRVMKVNEVTPKDISGIDLLVVGSPTRKFYPSPAIRKMIGQISGNSLKGIRVAAFDTRMTEAEIEKIKILAFFVKIFGYGAKTISDRLEKRGGELVIPPEGFYVTGMEGPLAEGEIERAVQWGGKIVSSFSSP